MAVVLGIETSDLFDCFLVPYGDFSKCNEQTVTAKLDQYHDMGVRVLFPVHKFDNAFSAGDGVSDEELEPLFKSAENYLRMWEKSEARGASLSQ